MENNLSNAPFFIGQEVVALEDAENSVGMQLIKDTVHIVKGMIQCKCGKWHVDIGLSMEYLGKGQCYSCGDDYAIFTTICHVDASLLAPVSRLRISDELTIAADLFQTKPVEERADVLIPETIQN